MVVGDSRGGGGSEGDMGGLWGGRSSHMMAARAAHSSDATYLLRACEHGLCP